MYRFTGAGGRGGGGVGRRAKFKKQRWINQTNCSLAFWMLLPA